MADVVGQPATAAVAFTNADQSPNDPATVVLSSISPLGQVTPYTVGVAPQATRISAGNYQLSFTPTAPGLWTVIGDGFDAQGNQVGAGMGIPLLIGPRRSGTDAQIQAQSIVEEYIGPFVRTTETVRLYSGEDGTLELPRKRNPTVTSILAGTDYYEDTTPVSLIVPLPTPDADGVIADPGIVPFQWYDVNYSHGWADADVPQIVQTVLAAVAQRIAANPDGVTGERIGAGYSVSYQTVSPAWLTADEMRALSRYRPYKQGTLVTSTPIGGVQ